MVAVMLPVMAMAAVPTEVATQEALKNAVANSGNIKLTSDIVLTETLTINSGVTIVLDLAGKKISADMNKPHMISSAGNLTIIDSVGTGSIAKEGNSSDYGYVLENHGTMVLNGIKVTSASSKSSAIENGWYTADDNKTSATCVMTITNSDISQTNGSGGLYTIKNDDYGVMIINGGNFTNSTASAGTVLNWNDLTINDGNFTGASAVRTLKQGTLGYEEGNTRINGGTFNGKIDTLPNYSGMRIIVTGGTFNTNVKNLARETVVVGYGNNYYVGDDAAAIVEKAQSGTITVERGRGNDSFTVKPGVTVQNNWNDNITVNGERVNYGETYTVPGAPIIIYTPTEDTPKADNQKNPGTGANDFVGVAAAMAVVSLLGAAAVIRKK
jgi:hypothetical protein